MKILFLLLLSLVPCVAQEPKARVMEPVKITLAFAKSEASSDFNEQLRAELNKSGRVAFVSKDADWRVFADAVPLDGLGCRGYSVALLVADGKQRHLYAYGGASLEALAREVATQLMSNFSHKE